MDEINSTATSIQIKNQVIFSKSINIYSRLLHFSLYILAFLVSTYSKEVIAEAKSDRNCGYLQKGHENFYLGALSYLEDESGQLAFQQIVNNNAEAWIPLPEGAPNFGFSTSAYWLKFEICPSQVRERPILEISYPMLDSIRVIGVRNEIIVYDNHTGDETPYRQRLVKHRHFIFKLPELENKPLHMYVRVQTIGAIQVPLKMYTPAGFFKQNQNALFFQGGYFGLILAMLLYNAFLFLSIRELPYLYYVLFTISFFGFQSVLQGFFQITFIDAVWWKSHALLIFGFATIFFSNLFVVSFLGLQRRKSILYWAISGIGAFAALSVALSSVLPYEYMVKLMLVVGLLSSLVVLAAAFRQSFIGHLPARIFTIAWLTLLVSFVIASLTKLGLIPRFLWTENIMQIGGAIEIILLSIALGERINSEKQQRLALEQSISTSLEEKVQKRTRSLNKALKQLESTNFMLDKLSSTDSLTQVANRRSFDKYIDIEFRSAKRGLYNLALIFIDIDHFKAVNDTYGHPAGDRVLQEIAKKMSLAITRPRDQIFRYGGEEFSVVLSNTDIDGALIVIEKLRKSVEALELEFDGKACAVTISAGIAVYFPAGPTVETHNPESLISEADRQLYLAKENGRNRIEFSKEI